MAVTKGLKQTKAERKTKGKKDAEVEEASSQERVARGGCQDGCAEDSGSTGVAESGPTRLFDTSVCVDCGKKVMSGLLCDGCGFWHHTSCEKVDDEVFNFLCDHSGNPSLLWYCKKCVVSCKKLTTMMMNVHDNQQQLEDKLTVLSTTMQQKFDEIAREFNKKLDMKFQTDIKAAGEESSRIEKRMEEKVDQLIDTVKNKIDIQDSVGEVVSTKLHEDKEELEEIKRRSTNIVIHGLKESSDEKAEVRMKDDEKLIDELIHSLECDGLSVCNTVRLGRKSTDASAAPRPLRLVLASEEQREKLLKSTKNLKGKTAWQHVFLHPDLTPAQREKRKALVKEMRQRLQQGEKDLIIVNNRIVTRKARRD